MQIQKQTTAKIQLTQEDLRQAVAEYIRSAGLDVDSTDIPEDALPETISFQVTVGDLPAEEVPVEEKPKAKPRSRAKAPVEAAPVEKEAKPEPEKEVAKDPVEEDDTMVPAADVEAYRAKMEADKAAAAKASSAHVDSLDDDEEDYEGEGEEETPAAPVKPVQTPNIFADDEEITTKKTASSIFDDDTPPQTGKVTENLFA